MHVLPQTRAMPVCLHVCVQDMDAVNVSTLVATSAKCWASSDLCKHMTVREEQQGAARERARTQGPSLGGLPHHNETGHQLSDPGSHGTSSTTATTTTVTTTTTSALLYANDPSLLVTQLLSALCDLVSSAAPSFYPRQYATVTWGLSKLATYERPLAADDAASSLRTLRTAGAPALPPPAAPAPALPQSTPLFKAGTRVVPGAAADAAAAAAAAVQSNADQHRHPESQPKQRVQQQQQVLQQQEQQQQQQQQAPLPHDIGPPSSTSTHAPTHVSSPFPTLLPRVLGLLRRLTRTMCDHPRFRRVTPRDAAQVGGSVCV